jgi:uncharacterized hydantoinase/oxoprolinase family protein
MTMNSIPSATTCIALLGLLFTAGANVAVAAGKQSAGDYDCYTDDGYGRKRSCAASRYKRKEADRNPFECVTDAGHGRKRACSDTFKR